MGLVEFCIERYVCLLGFGHFGVWHLISIRDLPTTKATKDEIPMQTIEEIGQRLIDAKCPQQLIEHHVSKVTAWRATHINQTQTRHLFDCIRTRRDRETAQARYPTLTFKSKIVLDWTTLSI
jgi:macrodomain Ter protein organizer (MatP/YcbG family)